MQCVSWIWTRGCQVPCWSITNTSSLEKTSVGKWLMLNKGRVLSQGFFLLLLFRSERTGSARLWCLPSLCRILYNYFHCIITAVYSPLSGLIEQWIGKGGRSVPDKLLLGRFLKSMLVHIGIIPLHVVLKGGVCVAYRASATDHCSPF